MINNESNRRITRSISKKQSTNKQNLDEIEKPYNKIITNDHPKNIINILITSQITGRTPKNIINLSTDLIDVVSKRQPVSNYIYLLKKLDELSIIVNYQTVEDAKELIILLKDIETRLQRFSNDQNQQDQQHDEFQIEIIDIESAKVFRHYGGIEILKRILLCSFIVDGSTEKKPSLIIKSKCINILNRLICLPNYGKQLVQDLLKDSDALLQYLFSLLFNEESRIYAGSLIESILLHLPLFNLTKIKNLSHMIETVDNDGLSCMCKIFAVTLSDLDSTDNKSWVASQRKQKQVQSESHLIRDSNHELLLNIPTLLSRLVDLVRNKDYTVRYDNLNQEHEHFLQMIDDSMSDDFDEMDDDNSSIESLNVSNINRRRIHNDDIRMQPALLAASKINNYVHVLYTLSLFLIGKERKKVQKILTKLKLASALQSLFEFLYWNCNCESNENAQNQIRQHLCPEVAVKIQLLRLVHSFCDNSDYKRVILSQDELEEILKYNRGAIDSLRISEESLKIEKKYRCTKDKVGLLSKIVNVIKLEPYPASFRFWLTRAIESYLRGPTSYADQLFLIKRGIVEDTTANIVHRNNAKPKEVLQSCFDMLGELIKFNCEGFISLNKKLVEIDAESRKDNVDEFIRIINTSLVDSNMFLRSVFLSIDFFQNEISNLHFELNENVILSHFDDFDRRIRCFCKMINIINMQNLSQENVSCLNTTLVVLMLANKKDQLPKYLKAIKMKSIENTTTSTAGLIDPLTNFKDLLLFWQSHYLQKDKDCIGLEQNSKIDFKYWKHTVELLLNTDATNQCSLNYYIESQVNFIQNNTNQIEEFRAD